MSAGCLFTATVRRLRGNWWEVTGHITRPTQQRNTVESIRRFAIDNPKPRQADNPPPTCISYCSFPCLLDPLALRCVILQLSIAFACAAAIGCVLLSSPRKRVSSARASTLGRTLARAPPVPPARGTCPARCSEPLQAARHAVRPRRLLIISSRSSPGCLLIFSSCSTPRGGSSRD